MAAGRMSRIQSNVAPPRTWEFRWARPTSNAGTHKDSNMVWRPAPPSRRPDRHSSPRSRRIHLMRPHAPLVQLDAGHSPTGE